MNLNVVAHSIQRRMICVENHLEFDKITTITSCLSKNYKGYQRSGIPLENGYSIWFSKLAVIADEKATPFVNGGVNTVSIN